MAIEISICAISSISIRHFKTFFSWYITFAFKSSVQSEHYKATDTSNDGESNRLKKVAAKLWRLHNFPRQMRRVNTVAWKKSDSPSLQHHRVSFSKISVQIFWCSKKCFHCEFEMHLWHWVQNEITWKKIGATIYVRKKSCNLHTVQKLLKA